MKTEKNLNTPIVRNKYTAQYKEQVLERADKDSIPNVTQDLGLAEATLYVCGQNVGNQGSPLRNKISSPHTLPRNISEVRVDKITGCRISHNLHVPVHGVFQEYLLWLVET